MKIEPYVARLNFRGNLVPNAKLLTKLHYLHVQSIPFENINNFIGSPVSLELDALFDKIILQNRGGYCYELNGLFHAFLLALGFDATLHRAKLFDEEQLFEQSVHAVILVNVQGQRWLLDVGYGPQGQLFPLAVIDGPQMQHQSTFQLEISNREILFSKAKEAAFSKVMLIETEAVALDYFNRRNDFHQTDDESLFKKELLCSLYSADFSKAIKNKTYTCYENGHQLTHKLENSKDLNQVLYSSFSLNLNNEMLSAINEKLFN